jgi:hypothetical protein
VLGERVQCHGKLRGGFTRGDHCRDVRRKLPCEETARLMDRSTGRNLAMNVREHALRVARRGIAGELRERHIRGHPGAELQFQLMQQRDEIP